MQITYLKHLPEAHRLDGARLYFDALKEKIEPIYGSQSKAWDLFCDSLELDRCLVAMAEDRVVGILGIQSADGGFLNPAPGQMVATYGLFPALMRMLAMVILHHETGETEYYVDGVAVAPSLRGKGVGSALFARLEEMAVEKGMEILSLEVVDTNPKARKLYELLGFSVVRESGVWPFHLLFGFSFQKVCLMKKSVTVKK